MSTSSSSEMICLEKSVLIEWKWISMYAFLTWFFYKKYSNFFYDFFYFMFTIIKWKWNKKNAINGGRATPTIKHDKYACSIQVCYRNIWKLEQWYPSAVIFVWDCKKKNGSFSKFQFPLRNVCLRSGAIKLIKCVDVFPPSLSSLTVTVMFIMITAENIITFVFRVLLQWTLFSSRRFLSFPFCAAYVL